MHNLIHLTNDVIKFGPLDNFSAFKFENFLYKIKNKLKKSGQPLQQIYNRLLETENINCAVDTPLKIVNCRENVSTILEISFKNFRISSEEPNNVCILKDSTIIQIVRIFINKNITYLNYKKIITCGPFFETPCNSNIFNIFKTNGELGSLEECNIELLDK